VNNFNKFKHIFTIFGTHYPDDTFYYEHAKICFHNLLVTMYSVDVIIIIIIKDIYIALSPRPKSAVQEES